MGLHGAVIFNSAMDELKKSADNLQAIRAAREKHDQDKQMFDINKKKAELQNQELEIKGQGTSLENQMRQAQINEYNKQQKTILAGQGAQIDAAEHDQTQKAKQATVMAKATYPEYVDLAQRLNPRLTVPGPDGGMIQGADASADNTPEAIPSSFENVPDKPLELDMAGKLGFKVGKQSDFITKRIDALKKSGARLLPEEQAFDYRNRLAKQGMKYNRGEVLTKARQMALDDIKSIDRYAKNPNPKSIIDMIPNAEKALYGESMQGQKEENPEPKKSDLGNIDEYTVGETRDVPGKGKWKYAGNNKWNKV